MPRGARGTEGKGGCCRGRAGEGNGRGAEGRAVPGSARSPKLLRVAAGGGGAALSVAEVEISPSVAGSAAEGAPARAARCRLPVWHRVLPAVMSNYIHVPPGSPEVPKLDITVSEQEGPGYRQGALQLLRRLRPHWRPEEVTLQVRRGPRPGSRGRCCSPAAGREGRSRQGRGEGGRPLCGGAAASFPPPPSFPRSPPQPPARSPICWAARRRGGAARRHRRLPPSFPALLLPTARSRLPPPTPSPLELGRPR